MKSHVYWIAGAAMTLAMCGLSAAFYPRLPEMIPIHWNYRGVADGFGHKSWAVWIFPALTVVVLGVMRLLPRISPRQFEIDGFRPTYDQIVALLIALFAFLHALTLMAAVKGRFDFDRWLFAGLFLFFALMGNVMGRVRRNYWVGIRVPWTLASERVWNDTHRMAAWLWVGLGLLATALALAGHAYVGMGVMVIAIVAPVIYSYRHYKALEAAGQI